MKAFVYGTLKRGYGNNVLLSGAEYLGDYTLPGFKLLNAGFPVAVPSEGDSILGELFKISEEKHLPSLDRLESNGRMYNRTYIKEEDLSLYVGHPEFWSRNNLEECPNKNKIYEWNR